MNVDLMEAIAAQPDVYLERYVRDYENGNLLQFKNAGFHYNKPCALISMLQLDGSVALLKIREDDLLSLIECHFEEWTIDGGNTVPVGPRGVYEACVYELAARASKHEEALCTLAAT